MPIELTGLFSMMLGVWYPRNYVVAAIDQGEGDQAVTTLGKSGFGHQAVHLTPGAGVLDIKRQIEVQRTPVARVAASISHALTDEGLMSQQYFTEAAAGASLIAVLAPEPKQVEAASRILRSHGARRIRFYGDSTITDL